jgi:hypothetical protein
MLEYRQRIEQNGQRKDKPNQGPRCRVNQTFPDTSEREPERIHQCGEEEQWELIVFVLV